MSVDRATVARIASLARINMSEEDLDTLVPEFNNILNFVEQLSEVNVEGVEPMTSVIPNHQRLREDKVNADPLTGGDIRDKVLANAPAAEHGFFGVPKVIE
ncbi:Asp-tRNA(Asn)/Glu-tRNA(Gln) amidotransferase subunit GatC [Altericroceibacterium spongiae]|uniref:Aspartyl/glutamyl-tRNA(Asn/Gln) amidotransferase subunit C n=1 Tax=Altericroceibacterium spongiae TaxID=2320269 RepID=A0A420EKI8_9SPHN|nr:Asp-tRNA(Asn)/Glu-tRNA(Gln) amidotransferase subunit GatC [Altericroceibacterium spongiae]RKF21106.1 Asp-tRNA(Asn)/Glu-tRNA(Gln) amidotransferase subunit GatC [Altericroceibacterium spongiae]